MVIGLVVIYDPFSCLVLFFDHSIEIDEWTVRMT